MSELQEVTLKPIPTPSEMQEFIEVFLGLKGAWDSKREKIIFRKINYPITIGWNVKEGSLSVFFLGNVHIRLIRFSHFVEVFEEGMLFVAISRDIASVVIVGLDGRLDVTASMPAEGLRRIGLIVGKVRVKLG